MRILILLITVLFLGALAWDVYPPLRGGGGWQWAYELPTTWDGVWVLAICLAIYLLSVGILRRMRASMVVTVLWTVLATSILGIAVVGVRDDAGFLLFTRTVSPVQTGASTIAVDFMAQDGTSETLRSWTSVMREALPANIIHFTTSPPGQALVHVAVANLTQSFTDLSMALRPYQCTNPTIMRYTAGEINAVGLVGMLMPLWMALGAIPFYIVVRLLVVDVKIALRLLQWYSLIPTMLLFLPTWNSVYPPLCLLAFIGIVLAPRQGGLRMVAWAVFAGVVMSVTTFLNFAVLPMLFFFGMYTLLYALVHIGGMKGLWRAIQVGMWFALGLSTVWIGFFAVSGYTPFDIFAVTFEAHKDLVQRNYWEWLVLHPYDTLIFAGLPVAGMFLWALYRIYKTRMAGLPALHITAISLFITFIIVNLSGVVQGENGRILSFYAPFFLLSGGVLWVNRKRTWDLPMMGGQALSVLMMASVLAVIPLDLNPMPKAPRGDLYTMDWLEWLPIEAQFSSDVYEGSFVLVGHRFVADLDQQAITVELQWRGGAQVERPYQFEIVATAENDVDGIVVSVPYRWYAQFENYLPTCWRDGETILDIVVMRLPYVSLGVVWELELRVVDERTGDVMRVRLPDGTEADRVLLAPVPYP